ncbi:nitrile hydratase accessory protein [Pseudomonas graminis]|uniref:nitrile hydratase accessory protein n=1 Tax=Pseudomonas graminis TaxID=158627 RepID=UPI0010614CC1|nr:nitrile hydratase accessory protein [Pseudomonas graminis]TDV42319.1 nitrile hydratase accessory protein [Pseudomonas graminis]
MNDIDAMTAARVPLDEEGPVFDAPWQANVFALTVQLFKSGAFDWSQWVQVIGEEIKAAPARPGERVNDAYYRQWTSAFERLIAQLGIADGPTLSRRAEQWRQAYLHTPHGVAVALGNADCPPAHGHPRRHGAVAISPATTRDIAQAIDPV